MVHPTGNTLLWGARAFAAFRGGEPNVYACPLCGREVPLSEARKIMSKEHAPSGKLGGTSITWTCTESCNNRWGEPYEAKQLGYDRALDFHLGMMRPDELIQVEVEISGLTVCCDVRHSGNDFVIIPSQELNSSETRAVVDSVVRGSTEGEERKAVRVRFHTPNVNHAWESRIATLRAAYLVAHAWLGYTYSFSEGLRVVRDQLQSPHREVNPLVVATSIATHATSVRLRREVFQVLDPDHLQCLVVQFGRYSVVLPPGDSSSDFYETFDFSGLKNVAKSDQMRCIRARWPSPPQYLLDINPIEAAISVTAPMLLDGGIGFEQVAG